jgi:hypothetical protein
MEGGMDREELKRLTKEEISRRIREGVKAVIEQVLEEEMTEHLAAGYRERTPSRRGERNGYYTRDLITPAGRIAQLRVPRDREGTFLTEVFERYKRMTGVQVGEEAVLEMYLQGVSTRKVAAITEGLSRVRIGKDAVSRVAQRLEEELSAWRGRPLELAYPYLYLDAAYFKVNWGGRVVDLALLVAVGVNEEGYREVLCSGAGGRGAEGGLEEPAEGPGGAGASGGEAGHFRRPPFHPPSGDGGASWGQLAAVRGALYAERFSSCAAVGAGCGGRGAPGGVCGAAAGHGGISGPGVR